MLFFLQREMAHIYSLSKPGRYNAVLSPEEVIMHYSLIKPIKLFYFQRRMRKLELVQA